MMSRWRRLVIASALFVAPAGAAHAQAHDTGWTTAVDGVAFLTFNHQGGRRGEHEVVSQNWVMGMASRPAGTGTLTLSGMFSAEPFTAPNPGYSALFQVGEAYRGRQITDHQHPHDLVMQLSAAWRVPLGSAWRATVAAAPRGEAALGPVAFMHRASSSENPSAPLSHHILDSTHIATSVLFGSIGRGPLALEASWFRGRESDEQRYDLELGRPDSWSTRIWFTPGREWTIQASHGSLHEPEQLEPGDQRRTNVSASWLRRGASGFTAATFAWGRTARNFSTVRAVLGEVTHQAGRSFVYSRIEDLTAETEILLLPEIVHRPHAGELVDPIRALTAGSGRDLLRIGGFTVAAGADVSVYRIPPVLEFTHGDRPVSFRVFMRVRPPTSRMWNMTMGGPIGSGTEHDHGGMHH